MSSNDTAKRVHLVTMILLSSIVAIIIVIILIAMSEQSNQILAFVKSCGSTLSTGRICMEAV